MLELFQRIFIGHNHKWEIIESGKVVDEYGKTYIGSYYQVQCSTFFYCLGYYSIKE